MAPSSGRCREWPDSSSRHCSDEVVGRGTHQGRVIAELAKPMVAVAAQQSADPAIDVAVVHHQEPVAPLYSRAGLPWLFLNSTGSAAPLLLLVHRVVVLWRNAICLFELVFAGQFGILRDSDALTPYRRAAGFTPALIAAAGCRVRVELGWRFGLAAPVAQKLVGAAGRQALCLSHALRGAETAYARLFLPTLWWHVPDGLAAYFAGGWRYSTSGVPVLGIRAIHSCVD